MLSYPHLLNHIILFFFSSRRRHTRSKRDWSSDVCSSDLPLSGRDRWRRDAHRRRAEPGGDRARRPRRSRARRAPLLAARAEQAGEGDGMRPRNAIRGRAPAAGPGAARGRGAARAIATFLFLRPRLALALLLAPPLLWL